MTLPCSRCGRETLLENFAKKSATQSRSFCKTCDSRRSKAYYYGHFAARRAANNANARLRYTARAAEQSQGREAP